MTEARAPGNKAAVAGAVTVSTAALACGVLCSAVCRAGGDPRFDRQRARVLRKSLPLANPDRRCGGVVKGRVPELAHAPFSCAPDRSGHDVRDHHDGGDVDWPMFESMVIAFVRR